MNVYFDVIAFKELKASQEEAVVLKTQANEATDLQETTAELNTKVGKRN